MEHVPAAREQLLVAGRCLGCPRGVVLRPPEEAKVRLVPDHDVVDLREAREHTADVRAVLVTSELVERRLALVEDGDDDAHPARLHDRLVHEHLIEGAEVDLAGRPPDCDSECAEAEVASGGDGRSSRPLEPVVPGPDQHAGRSPGWSDEDQNGGRDDDHPQNPESHSPDPGYAVFNSVSRPGRKPTRPHPSYGSRARVPMLSG